MAQFINPKLAAAVIADIPSLLLLLNSAYRGQASRRGWTTEAHLIDGDVRSDGSAVKNAIEGASSVMLKYTGDANEIIGCVNLQQHGHKLYLGMFAVNPVHQGGGIGKQLLHAAEEYARHMQCNSIYMTVISAREELINWYMRHGYVDTGQRKPFEEDGKSGRHLQQLEFMVLEKTV